VGIKDISEEAVKSSLHPAGILMLGSIASVAKERLSASGVGGQVGGGSAATGAERLSLELVDRECREAIRQSKEQLAALRAYPKNCSSLTISENAGIFRIGS